jgi:dihydrofolate reductase
MRASIFIATSLDGFIARTNGGIEWLGELEPGGEDYGYCKFVEGIDYLVMGRNTYEKVLTFGEWPYEKPVVVLTRRPLEIPTELASSVESMLGSPADIVAQLSDRGAQHLYVDGGKTIQGFLDAGLIQRLVITRIPVLLGDGLSLFGPLQQDIKLRHIETRAFEDGNVQSEYVVTYPTQE